MWRIEPGRVAVRHGDVRALARLFGLDTTTTDELLTLSAATKSAGFQQDHGSPVAEWAGMYADLEAAASMTRNYSCEWIPGLLQTPDYARAVTAANPALDADAIERLVAFRLQRHRSYFDRADPGRLDVVLTAGAFSLLVGLSTSWRRSARTSARWHPVTVFTSVCCRPTAFTQRCAATS